MVDTVNIDNVGGEQGVASEITLQKLLVTMELMANKTGADSKMAIKQAKEQYKKSIKELDKATRSSTKSKKENTKATKKLKDANLQYADVLTNLSLGAMGALTGSVVGLTNEFLQGGNELADFTQHLPVIGQYLGPFAEFLDNTISTFRELSTVGAGFGNDLTEMRSAAVSVGLTLDEFGSIVMSGTETLRVLGGTVQSGIRRFQGINKELKELETGGFAELRRLGFTVQEVNEGLISYVELQTRLGRQETRSNRELAASAADYLKEVDLLAKVTGKSRKQIEEEMQAQAADAGFRALQNQFAEGTEEFKNFRKSMTLIESLPGDVATGLKDLADGIPQTEEAIALVNAAGPEMQKAMEQVAQGADPQILLDALGDAGQKIEGFAGVEGQDRAAFIQALRQTQPAIAALLDAAPEIERLGRTNMKAAEEEQARADKSSESLLTFEDSVRKVRQELQGALIDSGVLDMVASGMSSLAETIGTPAFQESVKGFADAFVDGIKYVKEFFEGMSPGGALFTLAAGGLAAMFGPKLLGSALGGLFGGKGGAGGGKAGGGALGGLGKGLGAGAGGLISGLGTGLAAAGKMAVPIVAGAAAIGAAIGLIGAGIAGAAWLTGSALPTLTEGIRTFEEIDGAKLKSAGMGILELAKGMGAFAAGTAASGFGSVLGTLGENVSEFFGGSGPLDKLKEFSELQLDNSGLARNSKGLKDLASGMQAIADVSGLESKLDRIEDLDYRSVETYRRSLERLVDTLEDLNEELSGGSSWFGDKPETTAGDVVQQVNQTNSRSRENEVNNSAILRVLEEIRELNRRTLRAINDQSGNLY